MAMEYAADDLNYTDDSPQMDVGTFVDGTDGNKYEYIYNEGSTDITAYYAVALSSPTDLDGNVVVATAGDLWMCEGVAHTAIGSGEYGFICVRGVHSAACTAAVGTAGYPLINVAGGKFDTDAGSITVGQDMPQVWGYGVSTEAATPLVRLNCR